MDDNSSKEVRKMDQYEDIMNIIDLLDQRMGEEGTGRINLHVDDTVASGDVREVYHHGRCDVGSPWAKGTVTNPDLGDIGCN